MGITTSPFTARHRNRKPTAVSLPSAVSPHGLENLLIQAGLCSKNSRPLTPAYLFITGEVFLSWILSHQDTQRRAPQCSLCTRNAPASPPALWRETSGRNHPPAEQLLTGGSGYPRTWVPPQGQVMNGQPPLQLRLGAHLLQRPPCMGHSYWVGALGPSTPCQKLPMSLLVSAILLQGFTTCVTSPRALWPSMKVLQSSKAASL